MKERTMNVNTILIGVLLALCGFGGRELYTAVVATHDAVIKLESKMSGVEADLVDLRARVVAVEIDMQKLRKENNLK